jgi:hypothetical protein
MTITFTVSTVSTERYPVGTLLRFLENSSVPEDPIYGYVVENYKLPGDVCVCWETNMMSSYDEEWLDGHTVINTTGKR